MSIVYRGLDTRLDRPVAIKVLDPRFADDPTFLSRFDLEARSAAKLHHPGVVAMYDQGVHEDEDGEHVFLVMELVDGGGTLRDVIREQRRLSPALAIGVLEPVLSALSAAHRAGLVHRDIKPENVLIGAGGVIKVADFGLVRALASTSHTSASVILGTVAYLAPEQVATGKTDPRSDVYAAGIVLYEMLTGTPPYTGDTSLSVAYRHVNDDVPEPIETVPDLPKELNDLVVRATRRDPSVRPVDAAEFLAELQRVAGEIGAGWVPIPVPTPAPRPRRNPSSVPSAPVAAPDPDRTRPATLPPTYAPPVPVLAADSLGPQGTRAITRTHFEAHPMPTGRPLPEADRSELPPPPPPPPARPADRYPTERQRNRRRVLIWLVIVLLLAAAAGAGGWWLGVGRWTAVPSIIGQDKATAEQAMQHAKLTAIFSQERRGDRPAGLVISTDPGEGSRQLRGATVKVVISLGRPVVPEIPAGSDLVDAQKKLRDAELNPITTDSANLFDATVPAGKVLRVDPAAGTPLDVGTNVTILLSKGVEPPKPVMVPSVLGLPKDQAYAKLRGAGFEPFDLPATFSDQADKDHVAATTPGPGTKVNAGESRQVGIALSNAITVPNLVGQKIGDAENTLRGMGLEPDIQQFFPNRAARVLSQSPNPGARVLPGSRVTLRAAPF
jgi:serine/threonine-protein kinase